LPGLVVHIRNLTRNHAGCIRNRHFSASQRGLQGELFALQPN
jgi:hypothetical protein